MRNLLIILNSFIRIVLTLALISNSVTGNKESVVLFAIFTAVNAYYIYFSKSLLEKN